MYYIFIVNGREDKAFIMDDLIPKIREVDIKYEIYKTTGEGDATRFAHLIFSDIASDSDSAKAAMSVSMSSPEDSVEWIVL